jgi:hypothetical protein
MAGAVAGKRDMASRLTGRARSLLAAAALLAAALAAGCGGDGGPDPALLAGEWSGDLGLTYKSGGGSSGSLKLSLGQEDDFVSGIADWTPAREGLPVAGPVDDASVSLILHFTCLNSDPNSPTTKVTLATLVTGTVAGGTLTFTGASGMACPGGGIGKEVAGASGGATRAGNGLPLETPAPLPEAPTTLSRRAGSAPGRR